MKNWTQMVAVAGVATFAWAAVTGTEVVLLNAVDNHFQNAEVRIVDQADVPIELAANPQKSFSKKWGHGKKHPAGHPKR